MMWAMTFVKHNLIAFALVLSASWLIDSLGSFGLAKGSPLFLPMGAEILAYLIFGYRVLPGVMTANFGVGCILWHDWFGSLVFGFLGHTVFGSIAPILAIQLMRSLHLSDFFQGDKINFRHILFLILLTALINTLGKFFIYMNHIDETIDPVMFLLSYLGGDILGALVFIVLALKLMPFVFKSRLDE